MRNYWQNDVDSFATITDDQFLILERFPLAHSTRKSVLLKSDWFQNGCIRDPRYVSTELYIYMYYISSITFEILYPPSSF